VLVVLLLIIVSYLVVLCFTFETTFNGICVCVALNDRMITEYSISTTFLSAKYYFVG